MVETEWFTYAGPPKCGNHWITAAMKRAGVVSFDSREMHVPGHVPGRPRVTLVREPATWLRSFFLNLHGPMGVPCVDVFQALRGQYQESFEGFGWRYVNAMPGQISKMYMAYESEIELRTEHLGSDTAAMLSSLNVPCDFESVRALGKVGKTLATAPMSDEVRAAINATDFYLGDRTPAPAPSRGLSLKGSV